MAFQPHPQLGGDWTCAPGRRPAVGADCGWEGVPALRKESPGWGCLAVGRHSRQPGQVALGEPGSIPASAFITVVINVFISICARGGALDVLERSTAAS